MADGNVAGEIMKEQDQIKALAELDGWNREPSKAHFRSNGSWGFDAKKPEWNFAHQLPNYLNSYDAIIPLIQKQDGETKNLVEDYIEECPTMETSFWYDASPSQLCEALLRATGKWFE